MADQLPKAITLSVVVPAYNEEPRIEEGLRAICAYLAGKPFAGEVVVVDDGSTDQTAAVARKALAGCRSARVLRREENRGKGFSVREGVLASSGDVVLFADADMSTPIEEFDKFLPLFEKGFDVVIGSRALAGCDIQVRQAPGREAMGKFFNRLVRLLVLRGCPDTQCGFKAFRREAALDLFGRLETSGFAFDVELLVLARQLGCRVAEVPVVWRNSPPSRVRIVRSSWQMLGELFRIRRKARRSKDGPVEGAKQ